MSQTSKTEVSVRGPGCLGTIIAFIILWGLLFGVNYGGKHYGVSFGKNGVDVDSGPSR